jgi:hypothetical protein
MIFIVTETESMGPVSKTCDSPLAAVQKSQRLADEGVRTC